MKRKEHYRGKLPHYQQSGQWYFITCILEGAMPKGAMQKYSIKLEIVKTRYKNLAAKVGLSPGVGLSKSNISDLGKSESPGVGLSKSNSFSDLGKSESQLAQAKKEYQIALRKYRLAYDKILNKSKTPNFSLLTNKNKTVLEEALQFWEGKRLKTHAWCIMRNHFHWVVSILEKDENGKPVYLQDILHSVKLFSARQINKNENLSGQLWEHESFDTTIRDDKHFVNVVNYTINNPVSAGLVKHWKDWYATFVEEQPEGTRTFLSP